jgi:phosphomannomutase
VKKLIVFDLDGTLAESKSALDPEMSGLLHDLLGIVKVAVISGGDWPQFEKQVVSKLPHDERLANLSLLPTCGTKFYQYFRRLEESFMKKISPRMKERRSSAL